MPKLSDYPQSRAAAARRVGYAPASRTQKLRNFRANQGIVVVNVSVLGADVAPKTGRWKTGKKNIKTVVFEPISEKALAACYTGERGAELDAVAKHFLG